MNKVKLRSELEVLLRLSHPACSSDLTQTLLNQITEEFDWSYFLERAIATNLAGYLLPYPELAEKYYPAFVFNKLKAYQQRILLHSTLLREAILELAPQIHAQQIEFALLKGWDLHFRYGISLKQRQISDIDILIHEKDLGLLEALLQENGYQTRRHNYKSRFHQNWLPTHAPLFAQKGQLIIDVHTRAIASEHRLSYHLDLTEVQKIELANTKLPFLPQSKSTLFLYMHTSKHFESLHPFKAAQVYDLLDLTLTDVDIPAAHQRKMKRLTDFVNRIRQLAIEPEFQYDRFFMQQISDQRMSLTLRLKQVYQRLRPKGALWQSPILYFFELFPTKTYLVNRYGKGNYWLLNLKRFQ